VSESHTVFFLADQFVRRTMIPGVKFSLGKLRFSTILRTEYESVQAAYYNDMHPRNGDVIAHAA
jgi:hypothetical protein